MGEERCANNGSTSSGGGGFQLSDNDLDKIVNALGSRQGLTCAHFWMAKDHTYKLSPQLLTKTSLHVESK